jgi:hypothetical protein
VTSFTVSLFSVLWLLIINYCSNYLLVFCITITNNETIAVILDKLPVSLTVFRGMDVDSWVIEQCFFSSILYVIFKED